MIYVIENHTNKEANNILRDILEEDVKSLKYDENKSFKINIENIEKQINEMGEPYCFIASELSAYCAQYFTEKNNCMSILFNPELSPFRSPP